MTKPGPLLDDVLRDLDGDRDQHEQQEMKAQSITLFDDARVAFTDESTDIAQDDEMAFETRVSGGDKTPQPAQIRRAHAEVRHRFTRVDNDPSYAPRRVITLRDARRGRPPGKHGADPPA